MASRHGMNDVVHLVGTCGCSFILHAGIRHHVILCNTTHSEYEQDCLMSSMVCGRCYLNAGVCACDDMDARLKAACDLSYVAFKWCRFCDKHYARCKCKEPDFYVRSGGAELPMPPGGFKMLDGSVFVLESKHHKDPESSKRAH